MSWLAKWLRQKLSWRVVSGAQALIIVLAVIAGASVLATLRLMMSGDEHITGPIYLALVNLNLILAAIFIVFVGRRLLMLLLDRRMAPAGPGLHVRLLAIFSFLAIVPAVVLAVFSVIFLNLGIESWFSKRVTSALDGSIEVAQAYFEEHGNRLLAEAQSIARDPSIQDPTFLLDPPTLEAILLRERTERNLSEVSLYTRQGQLVAHVGDLAPGAATANILSSMGMALPTQGQVDLDPSSGRILAVAPVNDTLVLVLTRWIAPAVLNHLDRTRAAYTEYYQMLSERNDVRVVFSMFFVVITAVVLTGAIWTGLSLASRIVRPLSALVRATNLVRAGDLAVRVVPQNNDEIGTLSTAFNQMTAQLQENRTLLEARSHELTAVLTAVSAGVLSLEANGAVRIANRAAREVLGPTDGAHLALLNSDLAALLANFVAEGVDDAEHKIKLTREGGSRTLLVRLVAQERGADGRMNAVVMTFDDITDVISAQRVSAWADMARRIAHEIKNPLTPIQLSAERLRRKYLPQITQETELFSTLTGTIVHQVEDLRQMVNEFSDFARMPAPVFQNVDLRQVVTEIVTLQRVARPEVSFEVVLPDTPVWLTGDRSHLSRMLTNILENAVNAIAERDPVAELPRGAVKVVVEKTQAGKIALSVADNGHGLPDLDADQLFDPYVTTRKKGTGLGLAIVRKVVDEHGGTVRLVRRDEGGARVDIVFPELVVEAVS